MIKLPIFKSKPARRVGYAVLILTKQLKHFIIILCIFQLGNIKTANAKIQTSYGRIYNVQDYIDTAPGTGADKTTLGIQRCMSTVMHSIFYYCNNGNPVGSKSFTIIFPYKADNYQVNEILSAIKFDNGVKKYVWERPTSNFGTLITLNIIGLNVESSNVKTAMGSPSNTQLYSSYDATPNNDFYFVAYGYTSNGIESNPAFDLYINSHMINLQLPTGSSLPLNPPSHPNFLTFTIPSYIPTIQSFNNQKHNFFSIVTSGINSQDPFMNDPNIGPRQMHNTIVNICGIKLEGINMPDNTAVYDHTLPQHTTTFKMGCGVLTKNINSVFIDNMWLENYYGNGIIVNNRFQAYINGAVEVNNNIIKNVWGLRYKKSCTTPPAYDDMGDAISFLGINDGKSNFNYIENDILYTKQYGRIGLASCCEHNINTEATYNYIKGYDRGLHSENNLSGFTIEHNRIVGSETGIVFDGNRDYGAPNALNINPCPVINPSVIRYNYISNEGIDYNPYLQKIYPPHLFYAAPTHRTFEYWGTIIEENEFVIDRLNTFTYTNDNINYSCPIGGSPLPHGDVNNIDRFHLYSGIFAQKINCNLFRTYNTNNISNKIGGLYVRSWCPNDIASNWNPCSNFVAGTECTANQLQSNTVPIVLQKNTFIDCDQINFLHAISSNASNTVGNNYINNQNVIYCVPTGPIGNIPSNPTILARVLSTSSLQEIPSCTALPIPFSFNDVHHTNISCPPVSAGNIHIGTIGNTGTVVYTLMPGNVTNNTGDFTVSIPNLYTITATDANAATLTTLVLISQPTAGHCCNTSLVNETNMILQSNPLVSDLIIQNAGNGIIHNKKYFIDGTLIIDNNVTFSNCVLNFTSTGQVVFNGPYNFDVSNSTLQAACDWWQGIVANAPQQKVKIDNGSHIKNAITAVKIINDAIIEASNSFFEDNGIACIAISDISFPIYPGYINKNVFSSANNLPSPYTRTERGIMMNNVQEIKIGNYNDAGSGNSFSGMQCGIQIEQNATNGTASIQLYNNTFDNIHAILPPNTLLEQTLVNNTYTTPWGSAIYANSANSSNQLLFQSTLNVNHTNSPSVNTINNCDRGIVTLGMNTYVAKQKINNSLLGIMCQSVFPRIYLLNENEIKDAHIGVQLFGSEKYSEINNNTISLSKSVLTQVGPVSITPPVGIQFTRGQMAMNAIVNYQVNDNAINIKTITGVGIKNTYADIQTQTKGNTIQFSSNSTASSQSHKLRTLIGVWADKCSEADFDDNNTHGFDNPNLYDARNSYGMYMDNSPWCRWSCNKADYTRYGFYVWGDNGTKKDKVTFNQLDANEFAWFFLDGPATEPGTLGNLGDPSAGGVEPGNAYFDTHNWLGNLNLNPGPFKVFRLSTAPFNGIIFTNSNLLTFNSESGALDPNARYQVNFNGNSYTSPCTNYNIANPNTNNEDDGTYQAYIHDVVADTVNYINYNNVGSWMDRYKVYTQLDIDSVLRYSEPAILNFYNYNALSNIGKLREAERAINILYDSSTNAANLAARYANAVQANNGVSSGEDWEMNEKAINDALIALSITPADSLSPTMINEIGIIANLCPYVGGNGVLKARTLWAHWQPNALWDDRVLCMQGQNKNQDSSEVDIDSMYINTIKELYVKSTNTNTVSNTNSNIHIIDKAINEINVYPNPTSSIVVISYTSKVDGVFTLYNTLGEVVLKTGLLKENTKTQLSIHDIAYGVYHYEIDFANMKKTIGKLSIIK